MKKKMTKYIYLKCLLSHRYLLLVLLASISLNSKSQETTLVAIGNQSGVPSTMKLAELKSVLMGEKQRWPNKTKVTVALMHTNTPVGKKTAEVVYNMSVPELRKFFALQSLQEGNAQAPQFFNTTSDLQNYVAQNPGAIGVIDQSLANNQIKTITINGKLQFNP